VRLATKCLSIDLIYAEITEMRVSSPSYRFPPSTMRLRHYAATDRRSCPPPSARRSPPTATPSAATAHGNDAIHARLIGTSFTGCQKTTSTRAGHHELHTAYTLLTVQVVNLYELSFTFIIHIFIHAEIKQSNTNRQLLFHIERDIFVEVDEDNIVYTFMSLERRRPEMSNKHQTDSLKYA
jgi:hypothetical protein